ncbi:hypothetical protein BDP55DRAFT_673345 [Colletotrichum godetiae]|uniref:Uncharacterized protein n=1 Tax=Colletotrichum godetiae TaxID=1209918 RepID=A0AAJ0AH01_9PEZI|nr:uncharacterized protein BDP55DRAFT_673345 [Colletotrichum godetiae]KAK1672268.1 hypothetical protein BDP55DRAFT_673345 [Colletotrichum godetiae]
MYQVHRLIGSCWSVYLKVRKVLCLMLFLRVTWTQSLNPMEWKELGCTLSFLPQLPSLGTSRKGSRTRIYTSHCILHQRSFPSPKAR